VNIGKDMTITIDGRAIGPGHSPYVIAEMSGNHNGDIDRAFALMEAAKAAGADAVKLQTYTADTITIDHDGPGFRIEGGLWAGRTLYDLYQEAHTPWDWHEALFAKGRDLGITVLSAPFDPTAIELLESLNTPAYKIASFEIIDLPLIEKAAATGKPLIISTGMANLEEIGDAVSAARNAGCTELTLLHCISGYPTPIEQSNLRTVPDLRNKFDAVIGLSDHTLGTTASVVAVALGAAVIEKHLTLARADGGPDAAFSLEPDELRVLCQSCRDAWSALGDADYSRKKAEQENAMFRRSLYVVEDVREGEEFNERNVRSIRPGFGLAPKHLKQVLGQEAAMDLSRGTPLELSHIRATPRSDREDRE
jgi:N-acetylneuraminate synthase